MKKIDLSEIIVKNELFYERGEDKPYTGIIIQKYDNSQIKSRTNIVNGIKDGKQTYYHRDGKLDYEYFYGYGILVKEIKYIEDNKINYETSFYHAGHIYINKESSL
jgi:antitoxin component YwqK of YwqJK toxin-antitoxin module